MSFTLVTITGSYGSSATGMLTFTLTQSMSNSDVIIVPTPKVATLVAGAFSQSLQANTDAATVPIGTLWGVTEQVSGAQPRDYFIEIPGTVTETNGTITGATNIVQLSSLICLPWMVGLGITGAGIPVGTTITAINQYVNQLTLSANATANGTGVTLTITPPSSIDISTLAPGSVGWT